MICKRSAILDIDEKVGFGLLNRQFCNINQTDLFYFFTGDFQSFILSMLSYVYVRLILILTDNKRNMEIIKKQEIRKEMLWNDYISDKDFEVCYDLLISNRHVREWLPIVYDELLVGKWVFDVDISITELAKEIALNANKSSSAGKNANNFGKNIYEKTIRRLLNDNGWSVVQNSVKIKDGKRIVTDIDLIAYNEGIVIVGQIKLANCGRNRYDIWKASKTIDKAIEQVQLSKQKMVRGDLLYSILKKERLVVNQQNIKRIIPLVITSSSYFTGMGKEAGIPILSWDMFCQIIRYVKEEGDISNIMYYFMDLESLYYFPISEKAEVSEIDQEKFYISYEEYDYGKEGKVSFY